MRRAAASAVLAAGTPSPYSYPMAFLDTKRDRAAFLIFVLGLGLVWTLWPFSTGLIGAPVLYVVFAPVYRWLAQRTRPGIAAGLVVLLGVILVLGPGVSFLGVIAGEAQRTRKPSSRMTTGSTLPRTNAPK